MEGDVKFFNRKKGFGFISGEDGKDYFVHFTAVPKGVFLRDNDRVSFEPAEGERGLKAENVQLLAKGSERDDVPQESSEEASEEPAQEEEAQEPVAQETAQEESSEEQAEEEPKQE